jgi:hypothetical protein
MNALRVLLTILAVAFAGATFGQSGEQRGSIPPGQSKDGAAPSDGAIKGGTILPGETGGVPDGKSPNASSERAARCLELQGTLRDECLAQENRAATGGTKDSTDSREPDLREKPPAPR